MSQIDVFVCGPDAASETDWDAPEEMTRYTGDAVAVVRSTADSLNAMLAAGEGDYFAFVNRGDVADPSILQKAAQAFETASDAVAVLIPFEKESFPMRAWREYPSRLASLIAAPEAHSIVLFRNSAFEDERIGPFVGGTVPLWDCLIRAAREEYRIVVADFDAGGHSKTEQERELPALVPEEPDESRGWLHRYLMETEPRELVPEIKSAPDALALKAGLLQLHDYLDDSHQCSQSVQGEGRHVAGDYWHAIMHRREPDYSNSKYWFRRTGEHPIFGPLSEHAAMLLENCPSLEAPHWQQMLGAPGAWNPAVFVDVCEYCANTDDGEFEETVRRIQLEEMHLLLEQTYADASS